MNVGFVTMLVFFFYHCHSSSALILCSKYPRISQRLPQRSCQIPLLHRIHCTLLTNLSSFPSSLIPRNACAIIVKVFRCAHIQIRYHLLNQIYRLLFNLVSGRPDVFRSWQFMHLLGLLLCKSVPPSYLGFRSKHVILT